MTFLLLQTLPKYMLAFIVSTLLFSSNISAKETLGDLLVETISPTKILTNKEKRVVSLLVGMKVKEKNRKLVDHNLEIGTLDDYEWSLKVFALSNSLMHKFAQYIEWDKLEKFYSREAENTAKFIRGEIELNEYLKVSKANEYQLKLAFSEVNNNKYIEEIDIKHKDLIESISKFIIAHSILSVTKKLNNKNNQPEEDYSQLISETPEQESSNNYLVSKVFSPSKFIEKNDENLDIILEVFDKYKGAAIFSISENYGFMSDSYLQLGEIGTYSLVTPIKRNDKKILLGESVYSHIRYLNVADTVENIETYKSNDSGEFCSLQFKSILINKKFEPVSVIPNKIIKDAEERVLRSLKSFPHSKIYFLGQWKIRNQFLVLTLVYGDGVIYKLNLYNDQGENIKWLASWCGFG